MTATMNANTKEALGVGKILGWRRRWKEEGTRIKALGLKRRREGEGRELGQEVGLRGRYGTAQGGKGRGNWT